MWMQSLAGMRRPDLIETRSFDQRDSLRSIRVAPGTESRRWAVTKCYLNRGVILLFGSYSGIGLTASTSAASCSNTERQVNEQGTYLSRKGIIEWSVERSCKKQYHPQLMSFCCEKTMSNCESSRAESLSPQDKRAHSSCWVSLMELRGY